MLRTQTIEGECYFFRLLDRAELATLGTLARLVRANAEERKKGRSRGNDNVEGGEGETNVRVRKRSEFAAYRRHS